MVQSFGSLSASINDNKVKKRKSTLSLPTTLEVESKGSSLSKSPRSEKKVIQIDTSPASLIFGHKSLRRQEPGSPLRRSRNTSNVSLEVTVEVHSNGTISDPQMRFASDRDNASSSSDSLPRARMRSKG